MYSTVLWSINGSLQALKRGLFARLATTRLSVSSQRIDLRPPVSVELFNCLANGVGSVVSRGRQDDVHAKIWTSSL